MRTPFIAHPKLWFLVPLLSFLGSGIPAHATGQCAYDRNSAIHYANQYANEPGNTGYYWFPGHDRAGNDCASFASQCLIAGGIDVVSQANQNGFGYMLHAPSGYPQVISVANDLAGFLNNYAARHGDQLTVTDPNYYPDLPNDIVKGDIISLWDDDLLRYYHSLIIVQTQTIDGYVDPGSILVDCHSSLNDAYNLQQPLTNWWGISTSSQVPTARFFHINRTGEESTPACSQTTTNPCPNPPCCGQSLGKITAPTEIE